MKNGAGVPNGTPSTVQPPVAATAVREQDRLMPIANVIRIMRRVLPPHAKISDDAKELIQECVSEFISFVTGEANERCHAEHRKTVTAEDVVWAMDHLGFDDYVLPLTTFLQRMRESAAAAMATRAPPPLAVTAPGNGVRVQVQMQRAVYAPKAPVQGYAVAMAPVQATVFGGERTAAPYYREAGRSSHGGCGDEESSSNGVVPVPVVGTGQPVVAELSQSNPVQRGAR